MRPLIHEERRRSPRHRLYRVAKIKIGTGIPPRDCLVIDISDGGVRLSSTVSTLRMNLCCFCPVTVWCGKADTRWSGGAAMRSAPSSSVSSDLALLSRISAEAPRIGGQYRQAAGVVGAAAVSSRFVFLDSPRVFLDSPRAVRRPHAHGSRGPITQPEMPERTSVSLDLPPRRSPRRGFLQNAPAQWTGDPAAFAVSDFGTDRHRHCLTQAIARVALIDTVRNKGRVKVTTLLTSSAGHRCFRSGPKAQEGSSMHSLWPSWKRLKQVDAAA